MNRHVATRSRTRSYGYTVQDVTGKTRHFTGPACTAGWYKLRRDAQHRANVLNEALTLLPGRREYVNQGHPL